MLSTRSGKSFICSLHNSLAADVDPRAGCHLPVHRQPHSLEAIELRVVVPLADKICVRNLPTGLPDWTSSVSSLSSSRSERTIASNASQLLAARPVPP